MKGHPDQDGLSAGIWAIVTVPEVVARPTRASRTGYIVRTLHTQLKEGGTNTRSSEHPMFGER